MIRALFFLMLCLVILTGCTALHSPDSPFPNSYTTLSGATDITFTDLPANCSIEIYTLGGDLLRKIEITTGNGQYTWDLKNLSGENLRSGIYTYRIKSAQIEQSGKIVITR